MGGGRTGAKVRQVVSIFHDVVQLERALRDLESVGIQAPQLGMLAGQKMVDESLRPLLGKASTNAMSNLVSGMIDVGITGNSGPILLSKGPLAELFERSASGRSASVRSLLNKWLIHRHAQALIEQLEAGACLLWVKVCNEKEERQTCGVLLRLSDHPVQVHDISDATKPIET
jgi:hypothetical protein